MPHPFIVGPKQNFMHMLSAPYSAAHGHRNRLVLHRLSVLRAWIRLTRLIFPVVFFPTLTSRTHEPVCESKNFWPILSCFKGRSLVLTIFQFCLPLGMEIRPWRQPVSENVTPSPRARRNWACKGPDRLNFIPSDPLTVFWWPSSVPTSALTVRKCLLLVRVCVNANQFKITPVPNAERKSDRRLSCFWHSNLRFAGLGPGIISA